VKWVGLRKRRELALDNKNWMRKDSWSKRLRKPHIFIPLHLSAKKRKGGSTATKKVEIARRGIRTLRTPFTGTAGREGLSSETSRHLCERKERCLITGHSRGKNAFTFVIRRLRRGEDRGNPVDDEKGGRG